jgi:biopolymer transport protein ExbD
MAELTETINKKNTRKTKPVKKSTRVDLTPMVDLGFLLITFFIFTTTMSQPNSMSLVVPHDEEKNVRGTTTKESGTITLLLASNNSLYYYEGSLKASASNLNAATIDNIRDIIMDKKRRTPPDDLFVIIKAANSSVYKNVVDALDEMRINDVARYALVDITFAEEQVINNLSIQKK